LAGREPHRYAISVRVSPQIKECIEALGESHWKPARQESDAIRVWTEISDLLADGDWSPEHASPRRYLAIPIKPRQGVLLADGSSVCDFAIVTNCNDPADGTGLDLIRWQRGKAAAIQHAHDVFTNEFAGWCLPSQMFGNNAVSLRMHVLVNSRLSALKRCASTRRNARCSARAAALPRAQYRKEGRLPAP
jgi:hypothetical protein